MMKKLATAVSLGALAAAAYVPAVSAQRPNGSGAERARIIEHCARLNQRQGHDPFSPTGGVQYHYRACMANHGQPE